MGEIRTNLSKEDILHNMLELDTEKVVADEIKENANSVVFDESDIIDSTATEVTEEQAEDSTLPPFMQNEEG